MPKFNMTHRVRLPRTPGLRQEAKPMTPGVDPDFDGEPLDVHTEETLLALLLKSKED